MTDSLELELNVGATFLILWLRLTKVTLQIEVERAISKQREVQLTTENYDMEWTSRIPFRTKLNSIKTLLNVFFRSRAKFDFRAENRMKQNGVALKNDYY